MQQKNAGSKMTIAGDRHAAKLNMVKTSEKHRSMSGRLPNQKNSLARQKQGDVTFILNFTTICKLCICVC